MPRQLFTAMIAWAASLVVYGIYAIVVTPLVEPISTPLQRDDRHALPATRPPQDRDRELCEAYFPEGHWARAERRKVVEHGSLTILFRECDPPVDGQIVLRPLALVVFPGQREESADGDLSLPRDAIVLEAPAAVFQFDGSLELGGDAPTRLNWGQLQGAVSIRSDMQEPGPHDDLRLSTSDLGLNEQRMWTEAAVHFSLGASQGSGRRLEIRFQTDERGGAAAERQPRIAGVRSVEVLQDVRASFPLQDASLFADLAGTGEDASPTPASQHPPQPAATESPVEISCDGSFFFHMARRIASFEKNVEVLRARPSGPADQLSCTTLTIEFAAKPATEEDRVAAAGEVRVLPEADNPTGASRPRLTPTALEAVGAPVLVRMPADNMEARCARLRYEIASRLVSFKALDPRSQVQLKHGASEIRAPQVEYQFDPLEPRKRLGELRAMGPGSLLFMPKDGDPGDRFTATWQTEILLKRLGDEPVLTALGRPHLAMTELGELRCDRLHIFLRELETKNSNSSTNAGPPRWNVLPDRLAASGNVELESTRLKGKVGQLQVWFRHLNALPQNAGPSPSQRPQQQWVDKARRARDQRYWISGELLQAEIQVVGLAQRGAQVDTALSKLAVDGQVHLRQLSAQDPANAPHRRLELEGQRLLIQDAETDQTEIMLQGAPAQLWAQGIEVRGETIALDRGENRLWIHSPGELTLPLDRDLEGNVLPEPQPLTIRWQGWLDFDGTQLVFERQVQAQGQQQSLQTERLLATLAHRVDFSRRQLERPEIHYLQCQGGVVLEQTQHDAAGPTARVRMEMANLSINHQTGAIAGDGPGWIRAVRLAGSQTLPMLAGSPLVVRGQDPGAASGGPSVFDPPALARRTTAEGARLEYLRIDFQGVLTGNHRQREVTLAGKVHAVYGPVDSWDQIPSVPPQPQSDRSALALDCDALKLVQWKAGKSQPAWYELMASGNVMIVGGADRGAHFHARAQRLTFDGSKSLLVLDGDTQMARLWRISAEGAPNGQAVAKKIEYWRGSGEVKVENARHCDFMIVPSTPATKTRSSLFPAPVLRR